MILSPSIIAETGVKCGLLFTDEMVCAILAGQKTQSRRLLSDHQKSFDLDTLDGLEKARDASAYNWGHLFVKECFRLVKEKPTGRWFINYRADKALIQLGSVEKFRVENLKASHDSDRFWISQWRPSIFMPLQGSRILLKINSLRLEHLRDLSPDDAIAEGIERISSVGPMRAFGWKDYGGGIGFFNPLESYASLWNSIYGDNPSRYWFANPLVQTIRFEAAAVASPLVSPTVQPELSHEHHLQSI